MRVYDPLENLRHAPRKPSRTTHAGARKRILPLPPIRARLERATERCVGVGACRNTKGGVMCPSYRATGEEQHSTRGRARLLWEMLAGALRKEGFQSEAVHEALDLCLSCKACKTECPVQVDMAQYKSEFLAQHYKGRLHPLHHYIFGFADKMAPLGSLTAGADQRCAHRPVTSPLIKRIAGVAQERQLPRLAAKSYQRQRAAGQPSRTGSHQCPDRDAGRPRSRPTAGASCGPTPGTTTTTRKRWRRPKRF